MPGWTERDDTVKTTSEESPASSVKAQRGRLRQRAFSRDGADLPVDHVVVRVVEHGEGGVVLQLRL